MLFKCLVKMLKHVKNEFPSLKEVSERAENLTPKSLR